MARAQGVAAAQGFGLRCGDPAKPAAGIVWSPRLAQKPCGAATAPIRLSGHALKDWPVVLTDLLNRLLPEAESFQAQARAVRRAIDALRQVAARQTCEAPVGRQVIVHHLSRIVEEGAWEGGYLTGGITFCSLKPMRSIPSKNICLIGMNEEDFPRHPYRLGFDLMAAERRPGDRSLRDDDRYLFLETLLSARDTLSISYVGQSIRDHSEFMPSVVVCELLDFLNSVSEFPEGGVRKHLVVRHRLQPFHSAYFSGKESLFSFSRANLVAARRLQEPADPPAPFVAGKVPSSPEEFRSLDIQDLIGFFRHPCRHFVEKRLDIRLGEDTDDIREEEGYALNRLESYVHRDELTERLLSGDVTKPAEWEIYNARAELPLGAAGRVLHGSIEEEAREFCRTVKHLEGDAPPQFPDVVVNLDGFTVSGRVGPVFGNRLLRYRCAKMKPRDLLAAWIQHLFLATSLPEMAIETLVAGTDKVQRLQSVSDPEALLRKLLRIYAQGLEIPLPFFPEVSFEYSRYSADTGGKKRTAPLDAARREWFPQPYSEMSPPCDDIYNHTCFGHRIPDPLDQEFEELAEAICGPLIEHMDKVDVQKEAS
jgi:exodeoxyribonuclease V gamma subunit